MHGTFGLERQHHPYACVFWSTEWLLRAAKIPGLPATGVALSIENHLRSMIPPSGVCYGTVLHSAKGLYPSATSLDTHDFTGRPGKEKVDELQLLWPTHYVAWTLWRNTDSRTGAHFWHSMPVLELLNGQATLLDSIGPTGVPILEYHKLSDLASLHDSTPGGKDFASIVR